MKDYGLKEAAQFEDMTKYNGDVPDGQHMAVIVDVIIKKNDLVEFEGDSRYTDTVDIIFQLGLPDPETGERFLLKQNMTLPKNSPKTLHKSNLYKLACDIFLGGNWQKKGMTLPEGLYDSLVAKVRSTFIGVPCSIYTMQRTSAKGYRWIKITGYDKCMELTPLTPENYEPDENGLVICHSDEEVARAKAAKK